MIHAIECVQVHMDLSLQWPLHSLQVSSIICFKLSWNCISMDLHDILHSVQCRS